MIGNKEIMAQNIKKYMKRKGVTSADVCRALGFKTNTFSNWITAKIYPRIDKIEMLAMYFGVSKSALVENSENINLSLHEQSLILGYRDSDETTRNIVDKILLKNSDITSSLC